MTSTRVALTVIRKAAAPLSAPWLRRTAAAALAAAGRRGSYRVTIALVGDAEMRKANRLYRGCDRTTDVLSFPSEERRYLGDILISPAQIRRQAKEYGRTLTSEFALMLVHGVLHLLGHDHEKPADAAKMFPLQEKALKKLKLL